MKYILLFIYRILNIIVTCITCIIIIIGFGTFPIWLLFGYLFKGSDFFDMDVEDHFDAVWDIMHYPLDKFYDFIDDMDDNIEFNFNKIWNNNFWK